MFGLFLFVWKMFLVFLFLIVFINIGKVIFFLFKIRKFILLFSCFWGKVVGYGLL